MKSLSKLLLLFPALAWTSCDKKLPDNSITIEESEPEIVWDWDAYPKSSELTLRSMPCDIQPKRTFELKSDAGGIITFLITDKTATVKKEELIAKMDVETLSEAEERIKISEQQSLLEELRSIELEQPEQRKKAEEELAEAQRQVELLEKILTSPAMAKMADELFPNIGEVNDKALLKAKEDLAFVEKKFVILDDVDKKLREGSKRIQEMDLAKTKRQHEDVKERSLYKAPFDGELRLEVDYIEGQSEYTVSARETIASINDYEEIHAHISVARAKWVNLQPEQLYIELNDRNKTQLEFHDDRIERDQRTRKEERKYIFSVPLEDNLDLKRLAGTQLQGDLIYRLPEPCYIVSKYDLSLYANGKTESIDWNARVRELWPSATILAQGRTNLAIKF